MATTSKATPKGMRTVATRNISAHKLRMVLSVLAVVLGTAFISGSFTFTSTLQSSFDNILGSQAEGLDTIVEPAESNASGVPLSEVEKIEQVDGVGYVQPDFNGTLVLLQPDGTAYQTGGAPTMGEAWHDPDRVIGDDYSLVDGRAPEAPGEIALDSEIVDKLGFTVGGPVQSYSPTQGTVDATLVGTYEREGNVGGFVGIFFSPEQAQQLFSDGEFVPAIRVAGDGSVDQNTLTERVAQALPEQEVTSGADWAQEQTDMLAEGFSFLNYFFLAFGGIALLVGTFIIFNTFSMLVAQRLRELALLRAIGASKGQVIRSVIVEALVTGVIGSVLGVAAGFALAFGLFALLEALDLGLPSSGLEFTAAAVYVPLIVGIVITVLSALVPAWRAGKVAPVAAMRSGLTSANSKVMTILFGAIGGLGLVVGAVLAFFGTRQDETVVGASLVGLGGFLIVICTFLVMPLLAPIIAGGIGRIIGAPFGAIGTLASTNSGRNSWRTAATAFSLTLGLALVATFGTFGASTKASIDDAFSNGISADLVVQGAGAENGMPMPLPRETYADVEGARGVGSATALSYGSAIGEDGTPTFIAGVEGPMATATDASAVDGEVQPEPGSAIVNETMAAERGWSVGDEIPLHDAQGAPITIPLTGIYENTDTMSGLALGAEAFARVVPTQQQTIQMIFVDAAEGEDIGAVQDTLVDAVSDNPVAVVQTMDEMVEQQAGLIDQLLNMIYALLGLALIIAVLGIVNTLALSVIERKTELGMLRAIGTQRRQVRTAITLESTQIAIFGALIGAVMGTYIGWAFVSSLSGEGISRVAIPWGTIAVVLIAAAVVGVVAALWPAYRAAKTSPLEAIAEG